MVIKILEDFSYDKKVILRKDEEFNFTKGLNVLSGTNGSGKTTLLKMLRSLNKTDKNWFVKTSGLDESIFEVDVKFDNIISHFSEEDNSNGVGLLDMGLYLNMGGLQRQNKSNGESTLIMLNKLLGDINKAKGDTLILLDEIDKGLDLFMQTRLINIIKKISENATVIYSTHNYFVLNKFDSYNMDARATLDYEKIMKFYELHYYLQHLKRKK